MPPFISRKRQRSPSPAATPPSGKVKAAPKAVPTQKRNKTSVFEAVDAPADRKRDAVANRKLLDELNDNNDDDDESLSEADSDEFEDVPAPKRRKTLPQAEPDGEGEEEDDDDEEMDWEDAITQTAPSSTAKPEPEIGDISFTVKEDGSYTAPDAGVSVPGLGKKGPSKREKQVRTQTHCLHVQTLLWHNTVRNSWVNDREAQKTLVEGLPEGVKREVTRWREAMGTLSKEELEAKKKAAAARQKGRKGKKGKKGGGRDWNFDAEHLEQGVPNLSAGDPLLRLLKVLAAYWRKRFAITAPGLRKQGYMTIRRLGEEIKDWDKNKGDAQEHSERIEDIAGFRRLAKKCEGSRDVGAQLFCGLLRGLGLDTRMVANLQPAGLGWSKAEEANAKKPKKDRKDEKDEQESQKQEQKVKTEVNGSGKKFRQELKPEKPSRKSNRGNKAEPISLDDDSDSPLSSAPSDAEAEMIEIDDDDDESVVDVTPAIPKRKPNKNYDRDLAFPNYWVEVCSPASHKYIPVDPIVLSTIASNDELLQTFEPRGKKAEVGKQVMAYTIAFSSDGTAKDVTVRYLKKHQLPGKTKGTRMAVEKVPIYNRKGKVRRYEEYDWFRTVMSLYDRPENKRTAADELEETTDLKPQKPAKEDGKEVEKESLQWYKQSADFVLEQHLRREEAIKPGAKAVKTFTQGKGDKVKDHPVFKRSDVLACKTVESWHKEGRALKAGEHPMKLVPMRAVTLIRKREMEDAQRETGEKLKQGLYSVGQTDWIIPPPIEDGVIPKNAYGNMDVYVPTMVPEGAKHLPLKGSAKLCRKLGIDYAEACTGFEFGKQRAVPVLTGVVVAEEHVEMVRDAWRVEQAEVKRKEDVKRTAAALSSWRKMLLGLRVLERMHTEYAGSAGKEEEYNPFLARAKREEREDGGERAVDVGAEGDEFGGGGFFPEGYDEEEVPQQTGRRKAAEDDNTGEDGGFLVEEDHDNEVEAGGFLVEEMPQDAARASKGYAPTTPVSLQSMHNAADNANGEEVEDVKTEDTAAEEQLVSTALALHPRKRPTRAPRKQPTKATAKPAARPQARSEKTDVEDSSLSELEEASEQDKEDDSTEGPSDPDDTDTATPPPTTKSKATRKPASPKVQVTPRGKPTASTTRATRSAGTRNGNAKTAVRSKYFVASDSEDEAESKKGEEEEKEEEEEESEAEVVKPRRTTRRTSARV
ncbi:hypothetical protein B0A50_08440 [Salinomyces thailandicus]|uniref:Rad4-domain-containing protein n=1 Tax=Salinomyces thailandicus TaxID=706561 RepID=A0A4U0TJQ4_9PEZI|nr:hypothetical protein B0A50_08440 [Salinomyces thailandica]